MQATLLFQFKYLYDFGDNIEFLRKDCLDS